MDFKKVAQKAINSSITDGKAQLKTEDLIPQFLTNSNTLTIIAFDLAESKEGKAFGIVVFKEYPNHYYFCGQALTRIVQAWLSEMEYVDAKEASDELESQGGCPIYLEKATTKSGNEFIKVNFVD